MERASGSLRERERSQSTDERKLPVRLEQQQHGWCHIHRSKFTCHVCSPVLRALQRGRTLLLRPPHTALVLKLPPEIIHRIVEMVDDGRRRPTGPALVCRHWANVCLLRPGHWEDTLHGRESVMVLRELVSAPHGSCSYLKASITRFARMSYRPDQKKAPWLHLLPQTRRLLVNYEAQHERVSISPSSFGARLPSMRSIHTHLPRSVPRAFSAGIVSLELVDVVFRQFSDLQLLLDELVDLEEFEGQRLSWPTTDTAGPTLLTRHTRLPVPRRAGGKRSKLRQVYLRHCTADLEAITLCTSTHGHGSDPESALHAIGECLMFSNRKLGVDVAWKLEHECEQGLRRDQPQAPETIVYRICINRHTRRLCELRISVPTTTGTTQRPDLLQLQPRARAKIALWFRGSSPFIESLNWQRFYEVTTACFEVESIVFGRGVANVPSATPEPDLPVTVKDVDDWQPLGDDQQCYVMDKLPVLYGAGKISFVVPSREMAW